MIRKQFGATVLPFGLTDLERDTDQQIQRHRSLSFDSTEYSSFDADNFSKMYLFLLTIRVLMYISENYYHIMLTILMSSSLVKNYET